VKPLSDQARKGRALVRAYLRDEMTYATLWDRYNAFFQSYDGELDEEFRLLDGIWGDLEVTTADQSLIDDYPGHYLNEDELLIVLARKLAAVDAA
jgi:hypothetical protein